jgi:hypothetical protein
MRISSASSATATPLSAGNESANDTSRLDGDSSRQSKNRPIWRAIKNAFRRAAKAIGDREGPQPEKRKRRSGDKDSGTEKRAPRQPILVSKPVARGRYQGLTKTIGKLPRLLRKFAAAAGEAAMPDADTGAEFSDAQALDWLRLWQDSASHEHWLDANFSAPQDRSFPHL